VTLKVTPRAEHRRALRDRAAAADAENRLLRFKVAEYEREFDRAKKWIETNVPPEIQFPPRVGASRKVLDILFDAIRAGSSLVVSVEEKTPDGWTRSLEAQP